MSTSMNDIIYAKGEPDWTTLREHTFSVCRLARQLFLNYFPNLHEFLKCPDFFENLALAALFHDLGKASSGFQNQLTTNLHWGFRHEILSAAICEGLQIDKESKKRIIRTLITHHRDFKYLKSESGFSKQQKSILNRLVKTQTPLGNEALQRFQKEQASIIFSEIEKISQWLQELEKEFSLKNQYEYKYEKVETHPVHQYVHPYKNTDFNLVDIMLRGLLIASDHFASAGLIEIPLLSFKNFDFLERYTLRPHQEQVKTIEKNCLLIAPTGSGKTEAAFLWFQRQFKNKFTHLFYVLPYTASINAMYARLAHIDCFGEDVVGISHAKAFNALVRYYMDQDYARQEAMEKAQQTRKQSKKLLFPILITTPWQLIQYFFSIKFFETGLSFMMNSAFVIDEIHCYDAKSMGLFLGMIKFLSEKFNTKFFIMSATIPKVLRDKITATLKDKPFLVTLDNAYLETQCRHIIHIRQGQILDYIDEIRQKLNNGKRIILATNTVSSAIEIFNQFEDIKARVLLHGKFTAKDRVDKERLVSDSKLLVGTQAIEVSLDIDYDEMYTEPAPLDALLQRFGRVNRQGKKGIADIFVTSHIDEASQFIYNNQIIRKTLEALQNVTLLKESQVQELIDQVYSELDAKYEKKFTNTIEDFLNMTSCLRAYEWDEEAQEQFHQLFESINVIPFKYYGECQELIKQNNYIEIEDYMVPLTIGQFHKYHDRIEKHNNYYFIDMEYTSDIGLYGETSAFL